MRTSTTLVFTVLIYVCATTNGLQDSPSPPSEFLTQPSDVTVPVAEPVLLKCTVASKVELCRWYFLEDFDMKFFDKRVTPMLIKEFTPGNRQDCSIKIDKVRKIQEGQWLCQALKFHSSKFIMSKSATVRVITDSESSTWEPPADDSKLTPRNGRREDDINRANELEQDVVFDSSDDDIIQDVFVHETGALKCEVNQPITSCSWSMPNGAILTTSQDKEDSKKQSKYPDNYRIQGNLTEGNCSMEIHEVGYHDEGNWRCVVHTRNAPHGTQGPLLHLHILDENTASKHTHDGIPPEDENEESVNILVICLVTVSGILFILVLMLLMCLYQRYRGKSEESQRILQNSPRSSLDLQRKMIPVTDLTAASVMAVEARKKLPFDDHHFGHYNQYLDMSGSGSNSGDGYIMMPGSSIRSSTSSRTTLSTLSTFPIGRSRSASNSTTGSGGSFPHLTTIIDNPSYDPDIALHEKGLTRPDSVYSTEHLYEEIKEKIEEQLGKMEKIPEADSPTYMNIEQDCEGYMIPKKSKSTELLIEQSGKKNIQEPIKKTPLPDPVNARITQTPLPDPINARITQTPLPDPINATKVTVPNTPTSNESDERPPPYSTISQNGLTPLVSSSQATSGLDPGYSRVGNDNEGPSDPMERYDIPRPPIRTNPIDSYDVPRQIPAPVNPQPNISVPTEVSVDGLTGIIV